MLCVSFEMTLHMVISLLKIVCQGFPQEAMVRCLRRCKVASLVGKPAEKNACHERVSLLALALFFLHIKKSLPV